MDSSRFSTASEPESSPVELSSVARFDRAMLLEFMEEIWRGDARCRVCGQAIPGASPSAVAIGWLDSGGMAVVPVCRECAELPRWEAVALGARRSCDLIPATTLPQDKAREVIGVIATVFELGD